MSGLVWIGVVLGALVAASLVAVLSSPRLRSRLLHAFRRRRKPGDRRAPVAKRTRPPPGKTLEGALELRAEQRNDEALDVLAEIDGGKGLRRLLHAAALLEAGQDPKKLGDARAQLGGLALDAVRLRVAAALAPADADAARALLARVERGADPAFRAWAAVSLARGAGDEAAERAALVELLHADGELARTVAARDLQLEGAEPSSAAVERYGGFAFARDAIARFGAAAVLRLLERCGG